MHVEVRDPTSFLQGEGRVDNGFKVEECCARSSRHSTKQVKRKKWRGSGDGETEAKLVGSLTTS